MEKKRFQKDRWWSVLIKTLIIMKLSVFLICLTVLSVSASEIYSQNAKISLSMRNATIEDVMRSIEDKSEYRFFYTEKLSVENKVSIDCEKKEISEVLDGIFKNTDISYRIVGRQIALFRNGEEISSFKAQQQKSISGKVVDSTGGSLPGVSVVVKGTTQGIITDTNGNYTLLNVPKNAILVFSFVGMKSQEIVVANNSSINVTLEEESIGIEEVVAVGYGTMKKKDLTGSISSIPSSQISELNTTRIEQALVGKMAGVEVKSTNGEPGSSPQIRIRGVGSISAGVSPLYVVDGFPTSSIETINPNDIESMDVLKDASATAIYGSRGSNGVIIINTKRGTSGKAKISFDAYTGWQEISKRPIYMNAMQQAQYHYDGMVNNNLDNNNDVSGPASKWKIPVPPVTLGVLDGTITYDRSALDDVLRVAPQQQYQLSATGGNEVVKYAIGGEYLSQDGIIVGSDFKRYSLRVNMDAKLTSKLMLKMNFNPSFIDRNIIPATGQSSAPNFGVIGSALGVNPMYPLYNEDGSYFAFIPGLDVTPNVYNAAALAKEITNKQKNIGLLANVSAEYNIREDLSFNILLGADLKSSKGYRFQPNIPAFFDQPAVGTDDASMLYNWLTEYTLNYKKQFKNHNLSVLGGFSAQKEYLHSNSFTSDKFPNNLVPTLSAVGGVTTAGSADITEWSMLSYLGRFNYNYKGKYYVTVSTRLDGSSRFGDDKKYGLFRSAALAWRLSEETFLKKVNFLSDFKLRASYGETGNNNIGNYEQQATINYERYILNNGAANGFSQAKLANQSLTWEKQKQFDIGADISFFKSRIHINIDHFESKNTDLLLNVNIPEISGFSTALQNIGEVKNKGWEFVLSTVNLDSKNIQWFTDFNISTFKNEVIKLGSSGDPIYSGGSHVTMIGQPIGMFYGWLTDGIFLNQAEIDKGPIYNPGGVDHSRPGDIRFKDISGPDGKPDGIINNSDKTIMGSPYPDFYYGMTNRISFRNISLNISLQGSQGAQIFAESRWASMATRGRFGQLALSNNYWKSEQDIGDGKTPRPNNSPTGNVRGNYSQRYLDSGSFLRINNISLSYLIPTHIAKNLALNSIRVYTSATNPFLFTKNTAFNPEASNLNDPLRPGREQNDYPIPKSIIIGVNVEF